ncbi:MAG: ABC transporter ATP-binding protein [Pyrinomonadaceae bacterium]|nr:ABC transporter ATP-binding protein [Pyrinomonadaceae bacterium]MCX7639669.1 ABC transporter ATP-binding protein [Pyrinomonadaceae bacterium]MDW8303313.1 ABC transporter ATP-binding protein [Acidobacteriota bacterium]
MKLAVEIENLTKDYKIGFWHKHTVRALDNLNLKVEAGQIFGLLGPNGAGKTTTIKLLVGLIKPTAGNARILGRDIKDIETHQKIGYCPENPYFYDYLTAYELMLYFAELFGLTKDAKKRAEKMLNLVGLHESDWHKPLRSFSKGMLQRVGLAQSLINEPEVVFLDEPMSGLDPIGRREIRELIARLPKRGITVFMSTHILSDIEVLCDSVAILNRGKLAAVGKLDELLFTKETNELEVILRGVTVEALSNEMKSLRVLEKPSGLQIRIKEYELVELISVIKKLGGSVVSVQPVKMSLEDFFVKETAKQEAK